MRLMIILTLHRRGYGSLSAPWWVHESLLFNIGHLSDLRTLWDYWFSLPHNLLMIRRCFASSSVIISGRWCSRRVGVDGRLDSLRKQIRRKQLERWWQFLPPAPFRSISMVVSLITSRQSPVKRVCLALNVMQWWSPLLRWTYRWPERNVKSMLKRARWGDRDREDKKTSTPSTERRFSHANKPISIRRRQIATLFGSRSSPLAPSSRSTNETTSPLPLPMIDASLR